MKAVKEELSPTRVKLTVEVPFEELTPAVDAAYRQIAREVRVQGFRPGKVPPRIVDQRVGRDVVINQALNDALPGLYTEAVRQEEVDVLGSPEVDITAFADGDPLVFTAEVDVRPQIELPELVGIPVTVEDATVDPADVDAELESLRTTVATLEPVERPVETGDIVTLDLSASVDGTPVEGAQATGLSHEVGSGGLLEGLEEVLPGQAEDESRTFDTELVAGPQKGATAQVEVIVRSVKTRVLPDLDDDFASSASEFDTMAELRADIESRLSRRAALEQGAAARDKVLETLLERVEVPLPEAVVAGEVDARRHNLDDQLSASGLTLADWLASENQTEEEFETELRTSSEAAVRSQFVLDAIAVKEDLQVTEADLIEQLVRRAQRARISPEIYAQQVQQAGNLPMVASEVVRAKALALVLEGAVVTDASGNTVDLNALTPVPAGSELDDADDLDDAERLEDSLGDDLDDADLDAGDGRVGAGPADDPATVGLEDDGVEDTREAATVEGVAGPA